MSPAEVATDMFDLFQFFCFCCLAAVIIRGTRRAARWVELQLQHTTTPEPNPSRGTCSWDELDEHLAWLWNELTREETK